MRIVNWNFLRFAQVETLFLELSSEGTRCIPGKTCSGYATFTQGVLPSTGSGLPLNVHFCVTARLDGLSYPATGGWKIKEGFAAGKRAQNELSSLSRSSAIKKGTFCGFTKCVRSDKFCKDQWFCPALFFQIGLGQTVSDPPTPRLPPSPFGLRGTGRRAGRQQFVRSISRSFHRRRLK